MSCTSLKISLEKWKTPYSDISYWKFLFSAKKTKFLSGVWIILDCFVLSNSSRVTIFFTLFFNLSSRSWGVSSQPAEIQSSQFFGGILFFTVSWFCGMVWFYSLRNFRLDGVCLKIIHKSDQKNQLVGNCQYEERDQAEHLSATGNYKRHSWLVLCWQRSLT